MLNGSNAFIRSGGLDALRYSYTFIGNHDKPRALHCAAMDMEMFYTDLTYPDNMENDVRHIKLLKINSTIQFQMKRSEIITLWQFLQKL